LTWHHTAPTIVAGLVVDGRAKGGQVRAAVPDSSMSSPRDLALATEVTPTSGQAHTLPPARAGTVRLGLLTCLNVSSAVVYLLRYVPDRGNGSDFQVFYAGAFAAAHGGDPFDWPGLWRTEQTLYNGGLGHGSPFAFAPYGDPPPFALLLHPLTLLAEPDAYRI